MPRHPFVVVVVASLAASIVMGCDALATSGNETREVRVRTHDVAQANCGGIGARVANCGEAVDILVQLLTDQGTELHHDAHPTTYPCLWRR